MDTHVRINLDRALLDTVLLGCFTAEGVNPGTDCPEVDRLLDGVSAGLRQQYASPSEALERLRDARRLYRALGLDPTRFRPSSEALLRRVLLGKGLYRVNTVVDTANLRSLEMALPVGLYDLDRVRGDAVLRMGRAGEGYPGIGKDRVNLRDRPALFDAEGPFGNPSSDSFRTRITMDTRRILFVIFAPTFYSREVLDRYVGESGERMTGICGGSITWTAMIP